jgi:hypothetical protein
MSSRSRKLRHGWPSFLEAHEEQVFATGLPLVAFHSEDRFRRLLSEGILSTAGSQAASLAVLNDRQWATLEEFCRIFFSEYESYDPLEQFLAFKYELRRRGSRFHA